MKFSRMNKRKRKPINIPKHKGQNLSFAQKHEICKRYAKKPRPSQIDLANEYCVSQSSISEILSNREKWISIDESEVHKKKNRLDCILDTIKIEQARDQKAFSITLVLFVTVII